MEAMESLTVGAAAPATAATATTAAAISKASPPYRYRCTECNKRFANHTHFMDHLQGHLTGGFRCDRCPAAFSSRYTVKRHMQDKHQAAAGDNELEADGCSDGSDADGCSDGSDADGCSDGSDADGRSDAADDDDDSGEDGVSAGSDFLQCALCPWKFETPQSLTYHVLSSHAPPSPSPPPPVVERLACTLCGEEFKSGDALREHVWTHVPDDAQDDAQDDGAQDGGGRIQGEPAEPVPPGAGPRLLPCPLCGREFTQRNHLSSHLRGHAHRQRVSVGAQGGQGLVQESVTESRDREAAGEDRHSAGRNAALPFVCDICPRGYLTQFGLLFHERVHMLGRQYICRQCYQVYKSRHSLRYHLAEAGSPCGAQFAQRGPEPRPATGLARHTTVKRKTAVKVEPEPGGGDPKKAKARRTPADVGKRTCRLCRRRCSGRRGLMIHIARLHKGRADEACPARPARPAQVQPGHWGRKTFKGKPGDPDWASRPHACPRCPWRFKSQGHLQDHIQYRHVAVRAFKCDFCEKAFAVKRMWRSHVHLRHRSESVL